MSQVKAKVKRDPGEYGYEPEISSIFYGWFQDPVLQL
jgi:hypothetical protein